MAFLRRLPLGVALLAASQGCAGPPPAWRSLPSPLPGAPETTLFLLGDAGAVHAGAPLLQRLRRDVTASAGRGATVVAFLGDNLYPAGVREGEPEFSRDTLILSRQLSAVEGTGARILFVPGNHDWDEGHADGLSAILRQEAFFQAAAERGVPVSYLPGGGCPGPAAVDLPGVRLLVVDTQWFLQDGPRGCREKGPREVAAQITAALDRAGDRKVVVLSHHPLETHGPHGGHFTLRSHLFPLRDVVSWGYLPLPVLGSAYVLARRGGITDQDLSGEGNEEMRTLLRAAFANANHPPLIHAAGHEHSLQVLAGGPDGPALYLVSGAGSKSTSVGGGGRTLLAASAPGYMKVELDARRVRVTVIPVDGNTGPGAGWCVSLDATSRKTDSCR